MEQYIVPPVHPDDEGKTYFDEDLVSIITAKTRNEEAISALKEANNLINLVDKSGNTLLHIAAEHDNKDITQYLIQCGSGIDVQNSLGKTPLLLAIENRCQFSTDILLDADANIFISDSEGNNVLHRFLCTPWKYDASSFSKKFLKKVEKQCFDNSEVVANKLHDAGCSLPHVVLLENIRVTKTMLERGCQVDAREPVLYERTALHEAVLSSDVECVKLLLEYNADPNVTDRFDRSPLHYVYDRDKGNSDERLEIIKLLIERGAALYTSADNSSRSQVDELLRYGNREVMQILLQARLDLTRKHENDNTPVHILAANQNTDAFEALSDRNFNVDARNSYLETPLWTAAAYGNVRAVEFLLERGADVNAINGDYCSPLYTCIDQFSSEFETRFKECIQLLLEYGADVELKVHTYIVREYPTQQRVFDVVEAAEVYTLGELLIAHAVLREASEMPLADFIYGQIQSHSPFKNYYEFCKQQLGMKVYKSATLLDVLNESDDKFERYARDQQFASSLENFGDEWKSKLYHYNAILQKRYARAVRTLGLRKEATTLICKIMRTDYFQYPSIFDQIVWYLDERDLKTFLQVSF